MSDPWLTIIGLGEDGPAGLGDASRDALSSAQVIFGGPRHLALVGAADRGRPWPVPFDLAPVLALRGQPVVVLASGDPFWFGAGGSLSRHLAPGEWRALPVAGVFSLAAARLGWRIEETACLGLHAAPFARLRPVLVRGAQAICTLRDGEAAGELAEWLRGNGLGAARMSVIESLGGADERLRTTTADAFDLTDIAAPVAVAIDGTDLPQGAGLPAAPGLPEDCFAHDGQITKSPVRALTIAALRPRREALLWDIGAGSGSVSVEWCLAGGRAICIEPRADRCANIHANITAFGMGDRMQVIEGAAPDALTGLPAPDAVFIGGGGSAAVLDAVYELSPAGTRLVANAVTLESEALLAAQHARRGGDLMRIDLSRAAPLGRMHGWSPARPVVQWAVDL